MQAMPSGCTTTSVQVPVCGLPKNLTELLTDTPEAKANSPNCVARASDTACFGPQLLVGSPGADSAARSSSAGNNVDMSSRFPGQDLTSVRKIPIVVKENAGCG